MIAKSTHAVLVNLKTYASFFFKISKKSFNVIILSVFNELTDAITIVHYTMIKMKSKLSKENIHS